MLAARIGDFHKFLPNQGSGSIGDLFPNQCPSQIFPNQGLNLLPELACPNRPELNSSGQDSVLQDPDESAADPILHSNADDLDVDLASLQALSVLAPLEVLDVWVVVS